MHTKVWLLGIMNETQRKNVFNKFKANKMDFIEYDQIIVSIHVNKNH
jgi:ABC-type xylose transport system substrate-binding protein